MEIITTIAYLITAFIDAFLVSALCNSILRRKAKKSMVLITIYLVFPVIIFIMNMYISSNDVRLTITSVAVFLIAFLYFSGQVINKLYVALFFIAIILVSNIFTWSIVLLFYPDYFSYEGTKSTYIFIFGFVSNYIYIAIIIQIIRLFPKNYSGFITKSQGILLTLMPFSCSIAIILLQYFLISKISRPR